MIRRILSAILLAWFIGFIVFSVTLPGPLEMGPLEKSTSKERGAAIVLTGAAGRIEHAIKLIKDKKVGIILVTGVDPEVRAGEFAAEFGVSKADMTCCIVLGKHAVDTRGNAAETAAWVVAQGHKSIRLITSDWHMRRAHMELSRTLPADITIEEDAVPTEPSLRMLFLEYHKVIASFIIGLRQGSGAA